MDSPFSHLCAEESTDDKFFKSTSLYPLVSTTAWVPSAELPEHSSEEMSSLIFFREELIGWSLSSPDSSASASDQIVRVTSHVLVDL